MPSSKEIVIDFIRNLPDNLSVEEIAYKIYFNEKISIGQKQMREGKYISHEEAKEQLKE